MKTLTRRRGKPPKDTDVETLPNQVRKLRLARGYDLKQLAGMIGVNSSALSEFEYHGTGISRHRIYHLATIFDIDPRALETPGRKYGKSIRQPLDKTPAITV